MYYPVQIRETSISNVLKFFGKEFKKIWGMTGREIVTKTRDILFMHLAYRFKKFHKQKDNTLKISCGSVQVP